jgi:hypothetical protein
MTGNRTIQVPESFVQVADFSIQDGKLRGRSGLRLTGGVLQHAPDHCRTTSRGVGLFQRLENVARNAVRFRVLHVLGDMPVEIAFLQVSPS